MDTVRKSSFWALHDSRHFPSAPVLGLCVENFGQTSPIRTIAQPFPFSWQKCLIQRILGHHFGMSQLIANAELG